MITITSPRLSTSGPSLYKLIDALPSSQLRLSAEALAIIGQQLEQNVAQDDLQADIAIGMLRFSIFQLHQERIAQLAPRCRAISV